MAELPIHKRIERDRRQARPEGFDWSDIRTFRLYARGRQAGTLNADQLKLLSGVVKHKFADNILKKILAEHANRTRIARYDVDNDAVRKFLFDLWVKNQMPDLFADAVFATLRDGNHAISLEWVPSDDPTNEYGGRVALAREPWWDGKRGVFVQYGDDRQPEYAVKEWKDQDGRGRRNVYWPDALQRFVQDGRGWQPLTLPEDAGLLAANADTGDAVPGVIPWLKLDGSPLGIPIVHLPNGSDDDTLYGASLLDGGPLAFQDQLNAIQHDISAAAMMNGAPQTTSKGFDLPDDPDNPGTPKKVQTGPGMHHHNSEVTAEWGSIPPGDLSQLEVSYLIKLKAVCRNTNTPLHTITGEWPSGDALYRADLPLIGDAIKLADSLGPAMSTVGHRSTEMQNAFGRVQLDETALIRTVFDDPAKRDRAARWADAEKAAPHVSQRETLRIAGYTPDEIDAIMEEKEDEAAQAQERAQAAFNAGPDLDAILRANRERGSEDEPEGE
jgi:hypothetical protein